MKKLTHAQLGWLAGIIDSEGSIMVKICKYFASRRNKYQTKVDMRLRIATCDNIIIPTVCRLLQLKPKKLSRVTTAGNEIWGIDIKRISLLKILLPKIIPYLYIKQPHVKLLLEALNIKKDRCYTKQEMKKCKRIEQRITKLNERGAGAYIDNLPRKHIFSYAWLAGLIDGDGTISIGKWQFRRKRSNKFRYVYKPYMKIALAHQKTIRYLSSKLDTGILKSGKQDERRRATRAVRLLPTKLINILPKLIPHLQLKHEHAKTALKLIKLRNSFSNGVLGDPKCKKERQQIDNLVNNLCALQT